MFDFFSATPPSTLAFFSDDRNLTPLFNLGWPLKILNQRGKIAGRILRRLLQWLLQCVDRPF